jgi:glutathione S-transferase
MLELYYRPLACSLASRIACGEAGLPTRFRRVDFETHKVEDGSDFLAVSPKGKVPVLRTFEGRLLTEGPAVLQYLADRRPEAGLVPPVGDPQRYEVQAWLNFVATEIHKLFLALHFAPSTPQAARDHGRALLEERLSYLEQHLSGREQLVGERFTVADAYLTWALLAARVAGVELPAAVGGYLERMLARPAVAEAVAAEQGELAIAGGLG